MSWTQIFYNIKVLSGFKTTENIKSKKYEYTHNEGREKLVRTEHLGSPYRHQNKVKRHSWEAPQ